MPVFFINAKTQFENLGDGVITRQLIALARQHGPVSVLVVGVPAHFRRTLDLVQGEAVESTHTFLVRFLRARMLRRSGSQRVTGSVFYLLNPGGFEGEFRISQLLRQFALIVALVFLRLLGIQLIRIGCSLGPFGSRRLIIERIKSRLLTHLSARDPISIEYAKSHGLGLAEYFPDLAFLLPKPALVRKAEDRPVVCFSFRSVKVELGYDAKIESVLRGVVATAPKDVHFLVITQVGFDHIHNRELANRLGIASRCEFIDVSSDLNAAEAAYRNVDIVFSNRLHVLLVAMRQGAKIVAVLDPVKNRKIVGIFEAIGFGHCIWDINDKAILTYEDALYTDMQRGAEVFEQQGRYATEVFTQWVRTQ